MGSEQEGAPPALPALRARREVEKALLGAMCKFPSAYHEATKLVTEEDFWDVAHRLIFSAVCSMRNRGVSVEPASIFDELVANGKLQESGGAAYVVEVYESGVTAASASYYAGKVREQAVLDRLQRLLLEHAENAKRRQGNCQDIVSAAEAAVFDLSRATAGIGRDTQDAALVVDRVYDLIDQRIRGDCQGIPTGLSDLDMATAGLHQGQLVVIASRPSVGKTAVACNLVKSACHNGHPTLMVSLEMSAEEIGERLIVLESGTHSQDLRTAALNQADMNRIQRAGDRIRKWPLKINDSPCMRASSIASAARRESANGLGLLIVDYLQLIEPESRKHSRQEQVAGFSRGLKQLARSLQIPVVALAQLNRESEQRANKRPMMSDLRESGAIEADADVIVLLHRQPDHPDKLVLLVEKQRNGPRADLMVKYEPELYRLSDL